MNPMFTTAAKIVALACAVFAAQAQAATISRDFDGNDCVGYFGDDGFSSCTIFVNDGDERIELSPVIAKYEPGDGWETNTLYPSVDGTEFDLNMSEGGATGNWSYDRGTDDPGVRYWAVKAGDGFTLNWVVDDAEIGEFGNCAVADTYVLGCLDAALVVSDGAWATTDGKDLSHITFYDTEGGPPGEIPLPAAAWLFGSGLLGLLGVARRRKA